VLSNGVLVHTGKAEPRQPECPYLLQSSYFLYIKKVILRTVGGWIILGWILERWDGVMWTGLVWLRIGTGGELL
jgi:hypothetical protein